MVFYALSLRGQAAVNSFFRWCLPGLGLLLFKACIFSPVSFCGCLSFDFFQFFLFLLFPPLLFLFLIYGDSSFFLLQPVSFLLVFRKTLYDYISVVKVIFQLLNAFPFLFLAPAFRGDGVVLAMCRTVAVYLIHIGTLSVLVVYAPGFMPAGVVLGFF